MKLGKSVRVRERAFFGRTPLQCNFHRNAHAMLDSAETADVGIFFFQRKIVQTYFTKPFIILPRSAAGA